MIYRGNAICYTLSAWVHSKQACSPRHWHSRDYRNKLSKNPNGGRAMSAPMIRPLILSAALILLTGDAAPVMAQQAQTLAPLAVTEWKVPWANTRPRDPFVAADGKVWFVGQAGNYVANLD